MWKSVESRNWHQLTSIENQVIVIWNQLNMNWNQIERKLKSNWNQIERKLKSIQNQLDVNWNYDPPNDSEPLTSKCTSLKSPPQMLGRGGARH